MNRDSRRAAKRRTKRKAEKEVERQGPSVSIGDIAEEYAEALVDEATGPALDTDVDLEDRFG